MRHYSSYKNSGLSFIQKIPEYWDVKKAKYFFQEIDNRSQTGEEELLSVSHITGVTPRSEKNVTMFMAESYEGSKLCIPDDLVINIMWAWMGALGVAKQAGIVSPSYGVYRQRNPNDFNSAYLDYLVRIPEYIAEYHCRSKGIRSSRLRMYSEDFFQIPIICPPLDEQKAIVKYINQKLAEIDQFISYKRRLIELLNEQKTVLTNQAVTQGLDPTVSMKPSGIDWLGDIPTHWEASPLKYLAEIQTGITLGQKYTEISLATRPYLRVANVQDGYFDLSEVKTIDVPESEIHKSTLQKGDVLVTEGGDFDKLGRGYVWEEKLKDCLHQNHIFALRTDKSRLNPYFLASLLSSLHGRQYFIYTSKQTTNLASTNSSTLKSFSILLPPLKEQNRILEFICTESQPIDRAITQAEKEIELIQEYRTTLISDAVTGKIDVRDKLEAEATVALGGVRPQR